MRCNGNGPRFVSPAACFTRDLFHQMVPVYTPVQ